MTGNVAVPQIDAQEIAVCARVVRSPGFQVADITDNGGSSHGTVNGNPVVPPPIDRLFPETDHLRDCTISQACAEKPTDGLFLFLRNPHGKHMFAL